ncbi:MAG: hypothetical protein ACRDXX_09785 [Stackebrandtia sp.]
MNLHVQPGDVTSRGNAVSGIAEDLSEGTRKGRSLEITAPGLATAQAFQAYRDTWLGEGERLSLDLEDTGAGVVESDRAHVNNEDLIERGYEAINPRN